MNFGLITCNPKKEDLKAKAIREFGSSLGISGEACGANLYIDAVGIQAAIDQFMMLACREASLAIVGVHHKPAEINMLYLCYSNWHINGCGNIPLELATVDILDMIKSEKFDISVLVSHMYNIDEISEALEIGGNAEVSQKVCISYV
jgi:threonine dehydrogenase-like Zn-dependent dehydrogenase